MVIKDKPVESKLKILISYLPLLQANSLNKSELKNIYYEFINEIFNHAIKNPISIYDCYQLSLLAYMHPIFDQNQKTFIKKWLALFEVKIVRENKSWLHIRGNKFTQT